MREKDAAVAAAVTSESADAAITGADNSMKRAADTAEAAADTVEAAAAVDAVVVLTI